jgi:endonuclease/exonuclease/phosphatase (EEP) superfamily protein YafD
VIIGGDLNTDPEEMEEEAVNGNWLFEFFLSLNRSHSGATSHHKNKHRELDYIFSGMPVSTLKLDLPNIRNLSDHDPVVVAFQTTQRRTEAQIPDRKFANKLFDQVFASQQPSPT